MSALGDEIKGLIAAEGAISVERYMELALGHPDLGYYMNRDPFGAAGDFTTAPEISQMFGELLGLWTAEVWHQMGQPNPIRLIELGPGRGTLMSDALRAARLAPDFREAVEVTLVETSPKLAQIQHETLLSSGVAVTWAASFAETPPGPAILLANEFLDALPIRQFVRAADSGWNERYVQDGAFIEVASQCAANPLACAPGDILEINEPAQQFCALSAARVLRDGGVAIFIDYGHSCSGTGDTLQALLAGKPADPLHDPGSRDLTAHVDFAAMARAAKAAKIFGPVTQGDLLSGLGLPQRAQSLARANPDQAASIAAAADRLLAPNEMGALFKAIAIAHPSIDALPGFSAA